MMGNNRICIIGNNDNFQPTNGGQTIKVRTYLNTIEKEGFDVHLVDLFKWKTRIFKIFFDIKRSVKKYNIIIFMGGPNASRFLLPIIVKMKKKYQFRLIYSMIGTGTLSNKIKKLSDNQSTSFFFDGNYNLIKDSKISKVLKKVDVVFAETELISKIYTNFYGLSNCVCIPNFRNFEFVDYKTKSNSKTLKFCFLSRVCREKGIFDLINSLKEIDGEYVLDIFGPTNNMTTNDLNEFNNLLTDKILYKGEVAFENVLSTISNYDFLIFPTKMYREGMPGVFAESLIAGVPILTSNFPQSNCVLTNGYDSVFYQINDANDLKNKILYILQNPSCVDDYKSNAIVSGKKFNYESNRKKFIGCIIGD